MSVTKRKRSESLTKQSESAKALLKKKRVQYYCNYCEKDITDEIRMKCAECADFDLCLQCFSVGVEIVPQVIIDPSVTVKPKKHERTHSYRVMENLSFPIFDPDWGADEELLLLEGVELKGIANWLGVADHVGTKSAKLCQEHYYKHYINSPACPFPDKSKQLIKTREEAATYLKTSKFNTSRIGSSVVASTTTTLNNEKKEKTKPSKPKIEMKGTKPTALEIAGWMPKRGDFEYENDNEAEILVADLEFWNGNGGGDTALDKQLKMKILEIYNHKLDQRQLRKEFALDRGFISRDGRRRKQVKEDKDIATLKKPFQTLCKPLMRFHSLEEHEQFVTGIALENSLRQQLEQCKGYRRVGIRTLAEAEQYEFMQKQRDEQNRLQRQRESDSYLYQARTPLSRSKSMDIFSPSSGKKKKWLDISNLKSFELLSPVERQLCSRNRVTPTQYFTIKDTLIRECKTQGYLRRNQARKLIRIDVHKTGKLYDYFVSVGWINQEPLNKSKVVMDDGLNLANPNVAVVRVKEERDVKGKGKEMEIEK